MSRVGRRLARRGVRAGAILAMLAVQLVLAGAATAADRTESFYAAHVYTETRTTLVWDGKTVVVEGTVHCQRPFGITSEGGILFPLADSSARHPQCAPEWLATKLDDGSALLVGAYAGSVSWRRDGPDEPENLEAMREHLARVPRAVIWLDDPVNPTRGEYYFSSIALEDPRSRLTAISTELVSVSRHGMLTGPLFGKTPSDPAKVVPVPDIPLWLTGYYSITLPHALWSRVQGLEEILARFDDTVRFDIRKELTQRQIGALNDVAPGFLGDEPLHSIMWAPEESPMNTSAGRYGPPQYDRSLLMQPLTRSEDGLLQPAEPPVKGMIPLEATRIRGKDTLVAINFYGKKYSMTSDDLYFSEFGFYNKQTRVLSKFYDLSFDKEF